jgi:hypothetical protein
MKSLTGVVENNKAFRDITMKNDDEIHRDGNVEFHFLPSLLPLSLPLINCL